MCSKKETRNELCDLHFFNLALLAKQAWRLTDHPDSLSATILRSKYFPDGGQLNATLTKKSCYTWKPIMARKKSCYTWKTIMARVNIIKRSCVWRVCDGKNINIWSESWIPQAPDRRVITRSGGHLLSTIDLINPVIG